jgi:hypothetical protein
MFSLFASPTAALSGRSASSHQYLRTARSSGDAASLIRERNGSIRVLHLITRKSHQHGHLSLLKCLPSQHVVESGRRACPVEVRTVLPRAGGTISHDSLHTVTHMCNSSLSWLVALKRLDLELAAYEGCSACSRMTSFYRQADLCLFAANSQQR